MLAAVELTDRVCRHIGDDVCLRPVDVLDDEVGGAGRQVAEPALLPGANERASGPRVLDRGARGAKGQTTAGALAATLDRPRGRSSAACAERPAQRPQQRAAARAERVGRPTTGDATGRQEEVDEPRPQRYGRAADMSVTPLRRLCELEAYAGV